MHAHRTSFARPVTAFLVVVLTGTLLLTPPVGAQDTADTDDASILAHQVHPGAGMRGYEIYDVGGRSGVRRVEPIDIADNGVIGGLASLNGLLEPVYQAPHQQFDVLPYDGNRAWALSMASNGRIAGRQLDVSVNGHIVDWLVDEYGNVEGPNLRLEIDTSEPGHPYTPTAVAADGTMVIDNSSRLDPAGTLTPYIAPAGAVSWAVSEINDNGIAVGFRGLDTDGDRSPDAYDPVVWHGLIPTVLPLPEPDRGASAVAVNNNGDVLVRAHGGQMNVGNTSYLWSHGTYFPIAADTNARVVVAEDLNNNGEVSGGADFGRNQLEAFIWRDGRTIRLNQLVTPVLQGLNLLVAPGLNEHGQIAGWGLLDGVFLGYHLDPINPVVFVPGAAASRLSRANADGTEGEEMWLECGEDRGEMSLWIDDLQSGRSHSDIRAFEPLADTTCHGVGGGYEAGLYAYGPYFRGLRNSGLFFDYLASENANRYTSAGCDTSQRERAPNLFLFAYDWRRDSARSANQLRDFLDCVDQFWPGRPVNIVAHSLGSHVARRMLVDHPDANVDRVLTIGAPWLGAPKIINVLQTGDFVPFPANGDEDVLRDIVGSFFAPHQLASGVYYHDTSQYPAFVEDGWDIDGDGNDTEGYTWADLKALINRQQTDPATNLLRLAADGPSRPGTTNEVFQTHANGTTAQVDWRTDTSDVDYTHIVGLQAGTNTIGQVVATVETVCRFAGYFCREEPVIRQRMTCGDGTVPLVAASRVRGTAVDLNRPDADIVLLQTGSAAQNRAVEHTEMTQTRAVIDLSVTLLTTRPDQDPEDGYGRGNVRHADPEYGQCTNTSASNPGVFDADGASAPPSPTFQAPDLAHSLRYVSLLGATEPHVASGSQTTRVEDGGGWVDGVALLPSNRPDAHMVTLPLSLNASYELMFTATGEPLRLDLLEGTQQAPTQASRWIDADLPVGAAARLTMTASGSDTLRFDSDGNGSLDTVVAPTVRVTGDAALDVTAPTVSLVATGAGTATRYVVEATDDGTGVDQVLWSANGESFQPVDGPITAPDGTQALHAFATDRAGNRSAITSVALADVPRAAVTTATLDPPPTAAGWSDGPVTVNLTAVDADGGDAITSISYAVSGAQTIPETATTGATASVTVSAEGTSRVTFFSTAADGTVEQPRSRIVRIDASDPAGTIARPALGAVVTGLPTIAGTAGDAQSGVVDVDVELRNRDKHSWDGSAWTAQPTWLATVGTNTWTRTAGLPAGADLPPGGYRIRAQVTDGAGRVWTTPLQPFTVTTDAALRVVELPDPPDNVSSRSGTAINDRGLVVGVTTTSAAIRATTWARGTGAQLSLPEGVRATNEADVADDGQVVATGTTDTTSVVVRWDPAGQPSVLPGLGGSTRAGGISDRGQIVGTSGGQPVTWIDGTVSALPVPTGATGSADDVNDRGVIVGSTTSAGRTIATRWDAAGSRQLGTLGGTSSNATAVNDLGDIVGQAAEGNGRQRAFRFSNDQMVRVDDGLFATSAIALDINNAGQVVGSYTTNTGQDRAFLWDDSRGAIDLNTLLPQGSGWVLQRARGINEQGQIVGFGLRGGAGRAFVLTPDHAPIAEDSTATTTAGEPVEFTVDAFDPDPTDVLVLEVTAPPTNGTVEVVDGVGVRYTPAAGFIGTDAFTYRVSDGQFTSNPGTVTVTVDPDEGYNAPPTALVTGPMDVPEGSPATFDASGSTDPDGTIVAHAWDLDGDGQHDDADTPTVTVTPLDDGVTTVSVQVTDDGGATAQASTTLTATNVAPVINDLLATATVPVGQPLTLTATIADPGADTHAATIDRGDGRPTTVPVADHALTWTGTFDQPGEVQVTVEVCDDDGGCGSASTVVTVTSDPAPEPGTGLQVSLHDDRRAPADLNGEAFARKDKVAIFLAPSSDLEGATVDFLLDGQPFMTDDAAPFDFKGTRGNGLAKLFNLNPLAAGDHTVTAVIHRSASGQARVEATFTIDR